jgi:ATPase subunit of ABC transporter with duplicated ATPase domains
MNLNSVTFQNIDFSYDTASIYLFQNLSAHFPSGWTGIVGANGAGKTTLLRLAAGELQPNRGHIRAVEKAIYCEQRTDDPPELLSKFLDCADSAACRIKGLLAIEADWYDRWYTLSYGERKRAQIGIALWLEPDCLAVDEPTNHLDIDARLIVKDALRLFKGIGLLVSHDRELLDNLCRQCLFIDPPDCVMRPGAYTSGVELQKKQQEELRRKKDLALRKYAKLKNAAKQRADIAATAQRRSSKRGIPLKDSDAREKIDRARVTSKDATGGKLLRQLDGRLKQAREEIESIQVKKTYRAGIWLESSRSKRDFLLKLSSRKIPLGENSYLQIPDLAIKPIDRIGIKGPNGGGKSTLVSIIFSHLNLPSDRVIYLAQEISAAGSGRILARSRKLPRKKLGRLMMIISRLGSDPKRLLETEMLSPGELRKLMLALGITCDPYLIMMDEPTNHLDLPSIERLEKALSTCTCALLLVSHDLRFLETLCRSYWEIVRDEGKSYTLKLKMT